MPRNSVVTPDKFTTFGELLRFLRRKADLTQRELAIAVGYSESQISRLEKNERAPDEATLAARFIPALYIDDEPQWVDRFLELGAATHAHSPKTDAPQPIAEAKPTPHNLPIQLTNFIGREREITEVRQHILSARLVTLTGPGGCGKTRLALQSAPDLLDVFPQGLWLVELAPLTDPTLVPQTVAAVLGLKEEAGRALLSTLTDHLRGKRILLILDNCEHLVQASAQFADTLLHACPDVHILATSREMLGLAGERALNVPSLSMPEPGQSLSVEMLSQYESARLFADRAAIVMPDFSLTQENADAVAQICQRLDGIPLAIELAATRVKILQVEQIAARLNDAFRLLTGGIRTALPRQQTLQAAMDWSYELLPEMERRLFNRLSVFAGGWMLEAAERVTSDTPLTAVHVLDLLTQLVNKSLVIAERKQGQEMRYRLLEIIRQYGLVKLAASGEADAVRRRHAEYYQMVVETYAPIFMADLDLPELEFDKLEFDNLRAALAWSFSTPGAAELGLRLAVEMWGFSFFGGDGGNERRGWLDGALAHADSEGVEYSRARAAAIEALGEELHSRGDFAGAQALMTKSLSLLQEMGDVSMSASVTGRLGWLAREHGDSTTARLRLEESLALWRGLGHKPGITVALITLGEVIVMQQDAVLATALLEEGLTLSYEAGFTPMTGWALNHLGHAAQLQGEWKRAKQLHEESLTSFAQIGERHVGTIWANQSLGETALGHNDSTLAMRHFREALEMCLDLGDRAVLAWCLAGLAGVSTLNEDPERAAWLWGAAEALRQSIGAREAPASRATHERLQAEVRKQLGEAVFNAKWAEGQAASLEQAITEATG
jgi:predicted ATPase/transcriptional regulator with XRE-family HTH domain